MREQCQAKSSEAPQSAMTGMVAGELHGEALSWPVGHPSAAGVSQQVNVLQEVVTAPLPASVASQGEEHSRSTGVAGVRVSCKKTFKYGCCRMCGVQTCRAPDG